MLEHVGPWRWARHTINRRRAQDFCGRSRDRLARVPSSDTNGSMLDGWTIKLPARTATHAPTGLVLELVGREEWMIMRSRVETKRDLLPHEVERLLREGTIAYREAWAKRGC